ncbi:MAG: hypothetical protein AB8B74_01575 [Crocinitomicaceae bacterium]
MQRNDPHKRTVFLLFLLITIVGHSNEMEAYNLMSADDSLVLKTLDRTDRFVILKNQQIKVKTGFTSNKGRFISIENDSIELRKGKDTIHIATNRITSIKTSANQQRETTGMLLMILGGSLTGISLPLVGISILSLVEDNELYIIYTLPILVAGLGILKLGNSIANRKFKIDTEWMIINSYRM